jgi:hypothetical protein
MEAGMKFRGKTKMWAGRAVLVPPLVALAGLGLWIGPAAMLGAVLALLAVVVVVYAVYLGLCWISEGKDEAEDDQ